VPGPFSVCAHKGGHATENIVLHNVPFGGKLFRLESHDGNVIATPEVTRSSGLNSLLIITSSGNTGKDRAHDP
jgi:hypothetical protein